MISERPPPLRDPGEAGTAWEGYRTGRHGDDPAELSQTSDFRQLIDGLKDGIAVYRSRRCLYVNDAMLQDLGYLDKSSYLLTSPRQWVSRHVAHHEQALAMKALTTPPKAGQTERTLECRLRTLDERQLTAELSLNTIEFDGAAAIVMTLRDVTEAREMRQRLEQADRLASLGTLAAGVAHEINNPLAYVISNLGFAIEQLIHIRSAANAAKTPAAAVPASTQLDAILDALEEAGDGADRVGRIVQGLKTFLAAATIRMDPLTSSTSSRSR